MAKVDLTVFARRGAEARVAELNAELAEIYRAFPSLKRNQHDPFTRRAASAPTGDEGGNGSPAASRRKMTAAQRKAVGERMKKYWAERRAQSAAKKR